MKKLNIINVSLSCSEFYQPNKKKIFFSAIGVALAPLQLARRYE
jgi:hypothetical protein